MVDKQKIKKIMAYCVQSLSGNMLHDIVNVMMLSKILLVTSCNSFINAKRKVLL